MLKQNPDSLSIYLKKVRREIKFEKEFDGGHETCMHFRVAYRGMGTSLATCERFHIRCLKCVCETHTVGIVQ
jgi:hypothetical protein